MKIFLSTLVLFLIHNVNAQSQQSYDLSCAPTEQNEGKEIYLQEKSNDARNQYSNLNEQKTSEEKAPLELPEQMDDSESLTLIHHKSKKKVLLQVGDKIKTENSSGKITGLITAISGNQISIKTKDGEVHKAVDIHELRWIKKYNSSKGLRYTGTTLKALGIVGGTILTVGTIGLIDASYPDVAVYTGIGGFLSAGVIVGGYYLHGKKRIIREDKWMFANE
ncbi:MAG: hypothetical protein MK078_18230 [Crocinitomicaceae bacterium]|nr:hypothetical protein [Crocinitomicaceae bacterium]